LDEDGTPLGNWKWDDNEGEWVFEPIPQGGLRVNPKTSDRTPPYEAVGLALLLGGFGSALVLRRRRER
jgi:LPXTG-motif cell wall-anchored protein